MKQSSQHTYFMCPCFCVSCSKKNWQIYHSCYNTFTFYIALNLNCKVMLSHTLQTGCVIWQNASPNKALLWLCIHSLHTLNLLSSMKYSAFESSVQRDFADWVSSTLQSLFSIQMMYLLPQSSVMLYFFARSSLENTLVTIELRNLMCRLFCHFRYICWFSLTTFIWFFAWVDIFVRWLQNRVIKLCHSILPMTLLSA